MNPTKKLIDLSLLAGWCASPARRFRQAGGFFP
jgi:hypothetical protein